MTILEPTKESIYKAVSILKNRGVVAFATETVYGLGCDTFCETAIRRVYQTKGRPSQNPMITHILKKEWHEKVTGCWDARCEDLANAFWPGPLTIVVPRLNNVPPSACGGKNTIAIRCPGHPIAEELLKTFGGPISAPSANKSGYVSPTSAQHVEDEYKGQIQVLDGGPCEQGIESTVISLIGNPALLRPGTVTAESIEKIIGRVDQTVHTKQTASPGTTKHHYAPNTRTLLVQDKEIHLVDDTTSVVLTLRGVPNKAMRTIQMPGNPKQYGESLYAILREVDKIGANTIYIETPPCTTEWRAINDRLNRCANSP